MTSSMVAALYVQKGGVYYGLSDVEPWDEARDARKYAGPHPVIAHPPCERWGRYWYGGPMLHAQGKRKTKGDDGGCFAAALAAVRKWGGVLEHPEASHAWATFGLAAPPKTGGWVVADFLGGWTCCVEQGHYGHRARKATWLYAHGVELPSLMWGAADGEPMDEGFHSSNERRAVRALGVKPRERLGRVERLSRVERLATPMPFRDLLLSIARSASK